MGRNSGGSGGNGFSTMTTTPVAITGTGKKMTTKQVKTMLSTAKGIDSLPDRETQKQLMRGISRYETVMGLRERNIRIADLSGAYGVTYINNKGSHGIYLDRGAFSGKRKDIEARYKKQNYDTGFKNVTNRAIQHTITHELAHATWTSGYTGSKQVSAGKEIKDLYKKWMKDGKKKGYGSYGKSNVDEFWAEVVTKGIHGKSDKYTKKAISIAHKYKL